ncbi:MAG: SRPBCC domain-containing protein [Flavobacteriaceae bacterium]|jgi:hypothetical protein|nr:SRPBCC domain-containing protein [Flavobacteriaceae bacterium]
MKITSSILIQANASTVWQILMDFKAYAEWNPFIRSIKGVPHIGQQLQVDIGTMKFKPIVQTKQYNKHFAWLGTLWFKGVFDGLHRYEINEIDEQTCEFVHSEEFSGLLVPLLKQKLKTETYQGFVAMNEALKQRAEHTSL